jgi:sulfur-oxidizing protein SoxX
MKKLALIAACAFAISASSALAQSAPKADPAKVDAIIKDMFAKAPPEWQARTVLDETQRACTDTRNQPDAKQAEAIQKRELATVKPPADGQYLGDWKKGFQVANTGTGGQFSDRPGGPIGANCYACHQMDPKELSYGTLGPSLTGYGKDRNYDPQVIKDTWTKVFNAQALFACSNMPRFGSLKFLTEAQIKDVMAYLFDKDSPVNK